MSRTVSDMTPGWDTYLRAAMDRRRYRSAADLSRETGIGESLISRWLRGETQPDVNNLRRLAEPLKVPLLELLVAAGHITTTEARLQDVRPPEPLPLVDVAEAIKADGDLVDRAKQHLLNQYELLRELSVQTGTTHSERPATPAAQRPLRAVARKRPTRRDQP